MIDNVMFEYVNHRGEKSTRTVQPSCIWMGATEWHPEVQWLLKGFDVDKKAVRDFAMSEIANWRKAE